MPRDSRFAALAGLRPDVEQPPSPDLSTPAGLGLAMIDQLSGLSSALRQTLADSLWQRIPAYVVEENSAQVATGATLAVSPTFMTGVKIERIAVSIPAGATATLQLGSFVFPVQGGVTNLQVCRLMSGSDTRLLTLVTGSGLCAVGLYGEQLAPESNLSL